MAKNHSSVYDQIQPSFTKDRCHLPSPDEKSLSTTEVFPFCK